MRLQAGLKQMFGVFEAGAGQGGAGEHAGDLLDALLRGEAGDGGFGAASLFGLGDQEVLIGESRDLREVRDANDLLGGGEGLEFAANGLGGAASDADVNLVEDQGAGRCYRCALRFGGFAGAADALFYRDLESEQDARHLASGGDLVEWLEGLTGIGGDEEADLVGAVGRPAAGVVLCRDANAEARTHGEIVDLGLGLFLEEGGCRFPAPAESGGGFLVGVRVGLLLCAQLPEQSVPIVDFGELAVCIGTEGDDVGEGGAVLAFEALERGEAVFNRGEARGRGLDGLGEVADLGVHVLDYRLCAGELLCGLGETGVVAGELFEMTKGRAEGGLGGTF